MSRIGKIPISIPEGVTVKIENQLVSVSGPFGEMDRLIPSQLLVELIEDKLFIRVRDNLKTTRALHGLFRTLINNMVTGVHKKFEVDLQLKGVGYRCQSTKDAVTLSLGFSHPVELPLPNGVEVQVDSNTNIKVVGIDKEKVGFFASKIRSYRPPEPYNGKGVLYKGEVILRKAGKSGKK